MPKLKTNMVYSEDISHPIFHSIMSQNRFHFIERVLSFDDSSARQERFREDRLAAI